MNISINGINIEADSGKTILQVARENDIFIPTLCYHEKTGKAGKCRLCLVEINGSPALKESCAVEIKEDMEIRTDTPQIREVQKMIVELHLANGNHDCLICEQFGNCELQNAAYYLGVEAPKFKYDSVEKEKDYSSEFIRIDRDKCISCGRCVAACNNTVVNQVLGMQNRGNHTNIAFDTNKEMAKSTCVQCGECVQICPVGAIIDKNAVGLGRPWDLEKVESVCPYCGVGCKLELHVDKKKNKIVKVKGVEDAPVNEGMLCVKGRYGFDFVNSSERLTTPLIKENGKFREASWEEAIDLVASKLTSIKAQHGADSLMGFSSAKVTNEENYTFQKLFRTGIGTNNIDHCARL